MDLVNPSIMSENNAEVTFLPGHYSPDGMRVVVTKTFGSTPNCTDVNAADNPHLCCEFTAGATMYVVPMETVSRGVQAVKDNCCTETQTVLRYPRHGTVQYEARSLTQAQAEQHLQRAEFLQFLKKASLRVERILCENNVLNPFADNTRSVKSGKCWRVFSRWLKMVPQPDFQFVHHVHLCDSKLVTDIHWHPFISDVFVASYAEKLDFNSRTSRKASSKQQRRHIALVWKTSYLFAPMLTLEAPDDVLCIQFSLYDPHLIAGGCLNGKIVVWDVSRYEGLLRDPEDSCASNYGPGETPSSHRSSRNSSACSSRINSATLTRKHQQPVTMVLSPTYMSMDLSYTAIRKILWVPPYIEFTSKGHSAANPTKRVAQLYVCNGEGYISVWDVKISDRKDLTIEHPAHKNLPHIPVRLKCVYKMYCGVKDKRRDVAITNFFMTGSHESRSPLFEPRMNDAMETSFPSLCIAGSNEGEVLIGDWKNCVEAERGAVYRAVMCLPFHDGPVTGIHPNFFIPDLFLTIGGKTWALWRSSFQEGPVVQLPRRQCSINCAYWSPSQPAVCVLGLGDGQVQLWDLSVSLAEPCKVIQMSKSAITVLSFNGVNVKDAKSISLAVGDADGNGVVQLVTFNSQELDTSLQKQRLDEISNSAKRRVPSFLQVLQRENEKKPDQTSQAAPWSVKKKKYSRYLDVEHRVVKNVEG